MYKCKKKFLQFKFNYQQSCSKIPSKKHKDDTLLTALSKSLLTIIFRLPI